MINTSKKHAWYAIKVRTGSELRTAICLNDREIHTYVPTWIEPRRYSDRIKKVQVASFPGYLFSRLNLENTLPLLTAPGVDHIVSTGSVPTPIEEAEIDSIRKVVDSGSGEPWPYLQIGDKVEMIYGSFTGIKGILVNAKGKDRLILSVHSLQRSISMEISRNWVRPIARYSQASRKLPVVQVRRASSNMWSNSLREI